jgi:hypothetical protein
MWVYYKLTKDDDVEKVNLDLGKPKSTILEHLPRLAWITLPKGVNVRSYLPMDESQFIVLWKGTIAICQYDEEDNQFYICFHPADSGVFPLSQEREGKITHFMMLEKPKDY